MLYKEIKKEIIESTYSQFTIHCLDTFFIQPIFSTKYVIPHSVIQNSSVKKVLTNLIDKGILKNRLTRSSTKTYYICFEKVAIYRK